MVNNSNLSFDKIAFIGFASSGKDTCANYLVKHYNYTKISFADKLKEIIASVYGIDKSLFDNESFKSSIGPGGHTWRHYLQYIGTEGFRYLYSNTWVDTALRDIQNKHLTKVVISDLRFPNEFLALKQAGFTIVFINRTSTIPSWITELTNIFGYNKLSQSIIKLSNPKLGHDSEFSMFKLKPKADLIIDNNNDLNSLYYQLNLLLK